MKRQSALLALLLTCAGGCAENANSLVINGLLDPGTGDSCMPLTSTSPRIPSGLLDVGLLQIASGFRGYVASVVAINNLIQRDTTMTGERDYIQINGVDVQLTLPPSLASALPTAMQSYYLDTAGPALGPGGIMGITSVGVVTAEVIPAQVALQLANAVSTGPSSSGYPIVTVNMRVVGTHGGEALASAFKPIPVSICKFCLTDPPAACPTGGFVAASVKKGACGLPGQDYAVTCCTMGNSLLCGSAVPVAM